MTDVAERVKDILAEECAVDRAALQDDARLEDVGISSVDMVQVIFAIEEAFDIQVPFNANEPTESDFDISSVGAIVAGIEKLVADQKS